MIRTRVCSATQHLATSGVRSVLSRLAAPLAALGLLALPLGVHAQSTPPIDADPGNAQEIAQAQKEALHPPGGPDEPRGTCSGNALSLLYPFDRNNTNGWILAMARNDDGSSVQINLGFTFQFYGTNYTSCFINNNGNITFGSAFSTYVPTGFPSASVPPMIAPFWADVDTRNVATGEVWYKIIDSNNGGLVDTLVVVWDNVGYFNQHADLLDTFELTISNFTNPLMQPGSNVCFEYDNMCWTTGDINSAGHTGFTDPPSATVGNATAGINRGNGTDYFQIGRFGENNSSYDGPFGGADGVNYLDQRRFCFNTSTGNVPPVAASLPPANTFTVAAGQVLNTSIQFLSPEFGQNTTITTIDQDGAVAAGLVLTPHSGNVASLDFDWATGCSDVGTYTISVTARDNFVPAGVTTVSITVRVTEVNSQPTTTITGPAAFSGACTTVDIIGTANSGNAALFGNYTLAYATNPAGPFTTFANNPNQVVNGVLGTWDTTGLAAGYYFIRLRASNICGITRDFTTVLAKCVAPVVAVQPTAQTANETGRICLRVVDGTFCGAGFQWQRNGVNLVNDAHIQGATSDELIISPVTLADAGNYRCVLSNSCGTTNSSTVRVTIRCRGDFNGDGFTNSQDFFDFLTFFFGTCP